MDAEGVLAGLDALIHHSEDMRRGRMLYRISAFAMPTLGEIRVEMSRLPKLFGLLGKFDRCAVVSDTEWLQKAAVVEGALLPGIEIRSFTFDEIAEAEAWLAKGAA